VPPFADRLMGWNCADVVEGCLRLISQGQRLWRPSRCGQRSTAGGLQPVTCPRRSARDSLLHTVLSWSPALACVFLSVSDGVGGGQSDGTPSALGRAQSRPLQSILTPTRLRLFQLCACVCGRGFACLQPWGWGREGGGARCVDKAPGRPSPGLMQERLIGPGDGPWNGKRRCRLDAVKLRRHIFIQTWALHAVRCRCRCCCRRTPCRLFECDCKPIHPASARSKVTGRRPHRAARSSLLTDEGPRVYPCRRARLV